MIYIILGLLIAYIISDIQNLKHPPTPAQDLKELPNFIKQLHDGTAVLTFINNNPQTVELTVTIGTNTYHYTGTFFEVYQQYVTLMENQKGY